MHLGTRQGGIVQVGGDHGDRSSHLASLASRRPAGQRAILSRWRWRRRAGAARCDRRRARARVLATAGTAALALSPGALTVYLAFQSGGFFPGATAVATLIVLALLVLRVLLARDPIQGLSAPLALAAGALTLLAVWILASSAWSDSTARALTEFDRTLLYLLALVLFGTHAQGRPDGALDDLGAGRRVRRAEHHRLHHPHAAGRVVGAGRAAAQPAQLPDRVLERAGPGGRLRAGAVPAPDLLLTGTGPHPHPGGGGHAAGGGGPAPDLLPRAPRRGGRGAGGVPGPGPPAPDAHRAGGGRPTHGGGHAGRLQRRFLRRVRQGPRVRGPERRRPGRGPRPGADGGAVRPGRGHPARAGADDVRPRPRRGCGCAGGPGAGSTSAWSRSRRRWWWGAWPSGSRAAGWNASTTGRSTTRCCRRATTATGCSTPGSTARTAGRWRWRPSRTRRWWARVRAPTGCSGSASAPRRPTPTTRTRCTWRRWASWASWGFVLLAAGLLLIFGAMACAYAAATAPVGGAAVHGPGVGDPRGHRLGLGAARGHAVAVRGRWPGAGADGRTRGPAPPGLGRPDRGRRGPGAAGHHADPHGGLRGPPLDRAWRSSGPAAATRSISAARSSISAQGNRPEPFQLEAYCQVAPGPARARRPRPSGRPSARPRQLALPLRAGAGPGPGGNRPRAEAREAQRLNPNDERTGEAVKRLASDSRAKRRQAARALGLGPTGR